MGFEWEILSSNDVGDAFNKGKADSIQKYDLGSFTNNLEFLNENTRDLGPCPTQFTIKIPRAKYKTRCGKVESYSPATIWLYSNRIEFVNSINLKHYSKPLN